eukprot:4894928-Heterocapsa_arctica.AAC.1
MSIVLNAESTPKQSTLIQQNMCSQTPWTFVLLYSDSDSIWTVNIHWVLTDGGAASNAKPEDQD